MQTYKRYQNVGRIWQVKIALEQRTFEHSARRGVEMLGGWRTCRCCTCWCACSLPAVVCQMLCGRIVLLALVTLFPWSCACSLPAVVCQMLCGRTVLLETLMKAFQEGTSPCMHDQMDPFTNQVRIHTEDKTLIDAYVYVTPSTPSPIKSAYIPGSNLS